LAELIREAHEARDILPENADNTFPLLLRGYLYSASQ